MTETDEKLLDFTNTDDVSDAAIDVVCKMIGRKRDDPCDIRELAEYYNYERSILITARLIQQHRPDLLVDPVDQLVREEMANASTAQYHADSWRRGAYNDSAEFKAAKKLYLMGIEAGKSAS